MNYDYDLIIVGGGPAGSIMALSAHKQGLNVLLLDKEKFPRDKICGDALLPGCMDILQEFQLTDAVLKASHAWSSSNMRLFSERESLQAPTVPLLLSKRRIFDNILFQAAKSRLQAKEQAKVENLLINNGQVFGVQGTCSTGESFEYTAKVIAGADGCGSVVAKKLGLCNFDLKHGAVANRAYYRHLSLAENALEFYFFQNCLPGYFWIFPVNSEMVNVGVGIFAGIWKYKGMSLTELHRQLTQSPLLKERFENAEKIGEIQGWYLPVASQRRMMHGNGFILAGDAAGLIDPMWGDGIDTAMLSGKIAGEVLAEVCRGQNYSAEALQKYADQVWHRLADIFKFNYHFRRNFLTPFSFSSLTLLERFNQYYFQGSGILSQLPQ